MVDKGAERIELGFDPDFPDTLAKADNVRGGVSWQDEEGIPRSSSAKRWR